METQLTIEEIRKELKRRGWSYQYLAERLNVSGGTINNILSGSAKLTPQMAAHINLLLESTKTVFFAITVDIPESTYKLWVPGFENLTPKQQAKAVKTAVVAILKKLAHEGFAALTDEDKQAMLDVIPAPYRERHYMAAEDEPGD